MTTLELLTHFGLPEKAGRVYLALLERGASSVRQVAEAARINRQTTYELLRILIAQGLVTYYQERSREAYRAEDPARLLAMADDAVLNLETSREELTKVLPQLKSMEGRARGLATVRFYANLSGVQSILRDVLETTAAVRERLYRVYSSGLIAPVLYEAYPAFTKDRIEKRIHVRVLSLGGKGHTRGLDERKQLTTKTVSPAYIFIYGKKVATISHDEHRRPRGVLIEDQAVAESLALIFDTEWNHRAA